MAVHVQLDATAAFATMASEDEHAFVHPWQLDTK